MALNRNFGCQLEAVKSLEDRFEISNLYRRTTCIRLTKGIRYFIESTVTN